jgi:hypothetical protein
MGKTIVNWDAPPRKEVSGPYSIITGANLIKRKPKPKPKPKEKE